MKKISFLIGNELLEEWKEIDKRQKLEGDSIAKFTYAEFCKIRGVVFNEDFHKLMKDAKKLLKSEEVYNATFKKENKIKNKIESLKRKYYMDWFIEDRFIEIAKNNYVKPPLVRMEIEPRAFDWESLPPPFTQDPDYHNSVYDLYKYYEPAQPEIHLMIRSKMSKSEIKKYIDSNWELIDKYLDELQKRDFYISERDLRILDIRETTNKAFNKIADKIIEEFDLKGPKEHEINNDSVKAAYHRSIDKIKKLVIQK